MVDISSTEPNPPTSIFERPSSPRATLEDVLANQSTKPYTLDALLDFLTQDHCISTLDFIAEAKVYREVYSVYWATVENGNILQNPILVGKNWKHLMATYIFLESPSQIDLPREICNELLDVRDVTIHPPNPDRLDPAINFAYEMLNQDALVPFLKSFDFAETYAIPSLNVTPFHSNLGETFSRKPSLAEYPDISMPPVVEDESRYQPRTFSIASFFAKNLRVRPKLSKSPNFTTGSSHMPGNPSSSQSSCSILPNREQSIPSPLFIAHNMDDC